MAVTEHINSRLTRDKLCITSDKNIKRGELQFRDLVCMNTKDLECMASAEGRNRSLLQFVEWGLAIGHEYLVPAMKFTGGRALPSCRIYSPWMDLAFYREPYRERDPHVTPVSQILGIIRWNGRQLLADQAVLAGAKNVPPGLTMPLRYPDYGHFLGEYEDTEYVSRPREAAKPIEERVPPDLLWLFSRSGGGQKYFYKAVDAAMLEATEKSAEGYTKLVIALIDRCFASNDGAYLYYTNILDAADLIPLEQYRIDMPIRHRIRDPR
jgi:hypothetical protein